MGEGRLGGGRWVHRTASADPQSTALCWVGGAPRGPLGFPKGPVQDAGKGRGLLHGAGPEFLGLPTLNGRASPPLPPRASSRGGGQAPEASEVPGFGGPPPVRGEHLCTAPSKPVQSQGACTRGGESQTP